MGITPPDVTKELESGDIDGARKRCQMFLKNSVKDRMDEECG